MEARPPMASHVLGNLCRNRFQGQREQLGRGRTDRSEHQRLASRAETVYSLALRIA